LKILRLKAIFLGNTNPSIIPADISEQNNILNGDQEKAIDMIEKLGIYDEKT
jgi:hypothetical protein